MRTLIISALAAIALLQTPTGILRVVIRETGTSKPMAGVQIVVSEFDPNGRQTQPVSVLSDTEGSATFTNLAPGPYGILAQREGYIGTNVGGGPATIDSNHRITISKNVFAQ